MDFYKKYGSSESRREELEALHYVMMTKNYIND